MMTLPYPPRRAERTAFWLVLTAVGILVAAPAVAFAARLEVGLVLALGILLVGVLGLAAPRLAGGVYKYWNRLAKWASKVAVRLLLLICYFTVFTALRLTESGMARSIKSGSESTGWVARKTIPPEGYFATWPAAGKSAEGWLMNLVRWARYSGHYWVLALIPFLFLLRVVKSEEHRTFVSNLYTLF